MDSQQENFVVRLINNSQKMLDLRDEMQRDIALYNGLDFGSVLTDGALAAVERLAYLQQSDIWNAITAQSAVLTALGDDVSGQAVNLIKMQP